MMLHFTEPETIQNRVGLKDLSGGERRIPSISSLIRKQSMWLAATSPRGGKRVAK